MKKLFLIIGISAAGILGMTSCKLDNYDSPESILSGVIEYNGQPIGLRSNGVQLELWQHGFKLFSKIPVYAAQDGTFSAALFDGDYKLTLIPGNGPWMSNTDSIDVHVQGATTIKVEVAPYFIIKDPHIAQSGDSVVADFNIQQVNKGSDLEKAVLLLGTTTIVDVINNEANAAKAAADIDPDNPVALALKIPDGLKEKGYVFARIGIKTAASAEYLYTLPVKISLK